ncbi:LCHN protein [Chaetomidium leptoderma]|uniref:LCHN protein n=1 Tax=Chaetomidium leptoderma TaxID=669021 RepID=A0AAN6ZXF7_9PEZI|nr:LCHN protein [Chaetomidium leptoderma]
MAASRRGQPPLSVRLPQVAAAVLPDLPPISALFLIDFDVKAGYTITWKQAVPGLELEGTVEYKSLPSGLHTVSNDLIYFVHDGGHAGLSAFVNTPTDEEETRHARMIAVGVLVPLSYGRLGRAWRHAEGLKDMAAKLAADRKQTQLLQEYWEKNGVSETTAPQPLKDTPLESPLLSIKPTRHGLGKGHARNRSASDGTALIPPGHRLSPFHPAWSLTSLLDAFGPLIFPIHRAALLRKRILISCHAPVHEVCNFVYDISVLSNIPLSVCDVIDPSAPVQRLRPLFCIGVHDISYLLDHQAALKRGSQGDDRDDPSNTDDTSSGWVACTTDSILAIKEGLWDMLITMPPPYSSSAKQRVWPTVECPKGVPVKATQRDLRRFRSLSLGLARLAVAGQNQPQPPPNPRSPRSEASDSPTPATPAIRLSKPSGSRPGTAAEDRASTLPVASGGSCDDTDLIVEPTTWAALAYNGFMWWASAGEKRHSDEVDEQSHDSSLLTNLAGPVSPVMGPAPGQQQQRRSSFGAAAAAAAAGSSNYMVDSLASLSGATARSSCTMGGGDGEAGEADDNDNGNDETQARVELAVVAYFHRLSTSVFSVMADIVDSSDEDDLLGLGLDSADAAEFDGPAAALLGDGEGRAQGEEEARLLNGGGGRGWVRVDSEALAEMGLDVWSQADADFVREVSARYFGRRAYVETKGVEVCGVRVC